MRELVDTALMDHPVNQSAHWHGRALSIARQAIAKQSAERGAKSF